MPVYRKEDAKTGGFQQVREALVAFEGDVVKVESGQWGGQLVDNEGKPVAPREFFEIETTNNVPLKVTEDLSMDIAERFSFRVNMSDYEGSFWVDEFLTSADKNKILLPDGLIGKRVTFKKITREALDRKGNPTPRFNVTNFIIDKVAVKKAAIAAKTVISPPSMPEQEKGIVEDDPMALVCDLAVGKTEQQLRSAAGLHPKLIGSQILPLVKTGLATTALVADGKLILVDGKYQKP